MRLPWGNSGLLLGAVVALLAACDAAESPPDSAQLSRIHCRAALAWLTKGAGDVTVAEIRDWMVGETRNVSVVYDIVPSGGEPGTGRRDVMQCTYAIGLGGGEGKGKPFRAQAIQVHGSDLSARQVETLNMNITVLGTAE